MVLQPVLESLLHVDRLLFMKQKGYQVRYSHIFDDELSPRNVAIIVNK